MRRAAILFALPLLAGCGFTPLYATPGVITSMLAKPEDTPGVA